MQIVGKTIRITLIGAHRAALFPHADGVNFASWMLFNVPLMLVNVFASWLWLQFLFMGLFRGKKARPNFNKDQALLVKDMVRERVKELGAMSFDEGCTLALFIAVVLLWFFREPEFIPGWADIIPGVLSPSTLGSLWLVLSSPSSDTSEA
uniref:Uncharacterized protein n=1 Tax=Timema monikensis TaxID=170555 RepID=A0A7R9E5F6_9NEOP|nr:unnamed protein product [Timema monikensis]